MSQGRYCKSLARAPTSSHDEALTEWSKIFTSQATETYTSSKTFMKQLTFVAGSTITYLKNAFPEDNYRVEKLAGLEIRILKNECDDQLAQFLSTAMVGSFEAFEKKYLHQLAVCFYDGACKLNNLVEYHMLEYSYKPDGTSVSINSKDRDNVTETASITLEDVRESVTRIIRACLVAMSISKQPLPKDYDATVRLFYTEDAPEGYQVPGFVADTEDPLGLTYSAPLTLGRVETPYHKVVLSSYIKGVTDSNEIITRENPRVTIQPERPCSFQTSQSTWNYRSVLGRSSRLRCVCDNNESDAPAASGLLVCLYCQRQQHATCYGVRHCCVACSDEDSTRTPTDAKLASIPAEKRQLVAIIRQLVELCSMNENVSAGFLCDKLGVSEEFSLKLMRLLHVSGTIERLPLASWKLSKICHNQLKNLSKAEIVYALTGEEKDVIKRLVETYAKPFMQSSQSMHILEKELDCYIGKIMSKVKNPEVTETPNPENTTSNREASVLVEKDDYTEKVTAAVKDMDDSKKRTEKRKVRDEELSIEDTAKKARGPKFILTL